MADALEVSKTSLSHSPDIFRASVCALLTFLGITADCFFLLVLRRAKQIHYNTRWLMVSLAESDLCVAMFGLIPLVWSASLGGWPEPIGPGCIFHKFTLQIFQNCGLFSIMFLNLECYIAITRPFRYSSIITRNRTIIVITLQWLFWICWGFTLFFIFNDSKFYVYDYHIGLCVLNDSTREMVFVIIGATLHIFLPVTVVILIYFKIWRVTRLHLAKKIAERNAIHESQERFSTCTNNITTITHQMNQPRIHLSDYKAICSILLVTISVAIFWVPITAIEIYETTTMRDLPHVVVTVSELVEFSIPLMNVVILFLRYGTFRQAASKVINRLCRRNLHGH